MPTIIWFALVCGVIAIIGDYLPQKWWDKVEKWFYSL